MTSAPARILLRPLLATLLAAAAAAPLRAAEGWPSLSEPARAATPGGGENDAAVIVGAEHYAFVAPVPGARENAEDWQAYLTGTRGVPFDKVQLLRDNEATLEKLRKFSARAASQVGPGGTLWFIFIGHGAPAKDGRDGLLVGADAQQDPDSLYARSLPRAELLRLLDRGRQTRTVVLLDACFSGRSPSGEALVAGLQPLILTRAAPAADARTVLLTAAKSDQFAGPLPRSASPRPAFSYLVLGALRGWAADAQGRVTAGSVVRYAGRALSLDKTRTQTPELTAGPAGAVLAVGREAGPDLARLDRENAPAAPVTKPRAAERNKPAEARTAPPAPSPLAAPAVTPESARERAPGVFRARLVTTKGDIVVEIHRDWSPFGADRFFNLVKGGFYDGCAFFRVIDGFMAQVGIHGDPTVSARWRQAAIPDDPPVGHRNVRGTITFANAGPNSRTTQFFLNFKDNSFLDNSGFPPIGFIVEGDPVLDQLYKDYGDGPPQGRGPDQGRIQAEGNAYLKTAFPKMDAIVTARLVP